MHIIVTDLDGTLLDSNTQISERNQKAIQKAQNSGLEVVIATGRAYFDVHSILSKTSLSNMWVISANGAAIHDNKGNKRHSVPMNIEDVKDSVKWLEEKEYYYEVFAENAIYTKNTAREILELEIVRIKTENKDADEAKFRYSAEKQFEQSGFIFINDWEEIINAKVEIYNVLALTFDDEKRKIAYDHFRQFPQMALVTSPGYNFEVEHIDASKGNAVKYVVKEFGGSLQDTIALGDGFNDLPMFEVVGRSFAMGNAVDEIKFAANEIALTNDQDGVAIVIENYVENLYATRQ